jgi:Icc-related predicted phosphoesterase
MGLFGKRKTAGGGASHRIYFASDIHGAEVLWRKFLNAGRVYEANTLIMGGDVTGKVVIPLVEAEAGGWTADLYGDVQHAVTDDEIKALEDRIRNSGLYPHRMTPEQVTEVGGMDEERREQWFAEVMLQTFRRWLELGAERLEGTDVRCFMMPGNDDPDGVDGAIEEATRVEACDERIVTFGDYTMISMGWANRTPFDSPREMDESELFDRVSALCEQVEDRDRLILNLHVPPHDSQLDTAPALDADLNVVMSGSEPKLVPVGSTAVRELIEKYQPLLSLHGHVHESPGATEIGRTVSINPGSDYHTGRIAGCLINLTPGRVRHQFVTG